MKVAALVRIEWIKATRRRAFWVALGFLAVLSSLMLAAEVMSARRGFGAPFVAPWGWAMAAEQLERMPAFFLALAVVMLVASEFSWRTARQNVIDGLSKEQFFAAKAVMLVLVLFAFAAVPFAIATGATVYNRIAGPPPPRTESAASTPDSAMMDAALRARSTQNADSAQAAFRDAIRAMSRRPRPTYPPPDPDAPFVTFSDLRVFGGFAFGCLGLASMAFMLAIVLRSAGGAIGVTFLWFMFLEQAIVLLLTRFTSVETAQKVQPWLPVNAVTVPLDPDPWHPQYVEHLSAIRATVGQAPVSVEADAFHLFGLPLLWIALFMGMAFLDFRRRDL